jgi:uncharacterized delta-60 repeat protein
VTGYASNGGDFDFGLARYNADGSLDASFGSSGMLTTDFGGTDCVDTVVVQSDGRIVVAGYTYNSTTSEIALARYYA